MIPAALQGIISGVMLDVARVAGETAPLLFTSFSNRFWSEGWDKPIASLPVMIFTYAIAPYDDWHRQAWAAGFVLLMLILVTNIIARVMLRRRMWSGAQDNTASNQNSSDNPPSRVARLSYLKGNVSFLRAGLTRWTRRR